ncbi:hypothetical protein RYZ26_06715 [Terasakiella sp. A23]|uniref:hypothetical protein n=1 Tax=Terasakiella sp. FCG-A23 TaxID=3080561 RepID=UPI0029549A37|nr:hypothetical protein [Terasakiella sp. A23]MDV7339278.1 hypothetical protein [Terasakiella sp. A23]
MLRRLFIFVFSFCLFLSSHETRADTTTLRLATLSFPPLIHHTATGSYSGTMGETVKMMCRMAGIDCRMELIPYKRAFEKLNAGEIDGVIGIKTNLLKECCTPSQWASPWAAGLFSARPLNEIPQIADDIKGQSLIVVDGMQSPYLFIPDLDQWEKDGDIRLHRANGIFMATNMLGNERAEFLWGSEDYNWYFEKLETKEQWNFIPLLVRPLVIWLDKSKFEEMNSLNKAYSRMQDQQMLNSRQLLSNELMQQNYIAPVFNYE